MTQQQLDREVAIATGEAITDIQQHGFSLVDTDDTETFDRDWHDWNEYVPQMIDWDQYDLERSIVVCNPDDCPW